MTTAVSLAMFSCLRVTAQEQKLAFGKTRKLHNIFAILIITM
jgi:hypothetical protein